MSKAKEYEAQAQSEYPEIKGIKKDLSSLKANTVGLARHVQADGVEQAAALSEKTQDLVARLKEKSATEFHKIEDQVRAKPGQSIAMAFAAGIVASFLFGRR
jgi:ElaB/YqjD/DUF883 family membrane-anchored ribosome-binding protein